MTPPTDLKAERSPLAFVVVCVCVREEGKVSTSSNAWLRLKVFLLTKKKKKKKQQVKKPRVVGSSDSFELGAKAAAIRLTLRSLSTANNRLLWHSSGNHSQHSGSFAAELLFLFMRKN